jgi:superfamily I DNA/RNA helicase
MDEDQAVLRAGNCSVVAPAGYGKTETIARVAGACRRALILTHTHAGVHAVRSRLKKLDIPHRQVSVDTFAGWCMKYANSFCGTAQPPGPTPQGPEWSALYKGTARALTVPAVQQVIEASYDRILIDEYQDCDACQHNVALALSDIVPTTVFGDPMQGIFEFAGATLDWKTAVFPSFPLVAELTVPYRWKAANPQLGTWISETRERLITGQTVDFTDDRITWQQSDDDFDMGVFFDGLDFEAASVAAIHCHKLLCYRLARATGGAFQAIEELETRRLKLFAADWDAARATKTYHPVVQRFFVDCFRKGQPSEDDVKEDAAAVEVLLKDLSAELTGLDPARAALSLLFAARDHPRWRLFRSGLWRDCERALTELANNRCETLTAAYNAVRLRNNNVGRHLPKRTISTPLLLKGLEFQDVIIPKASHFYAEDTAQAKLFYVAISRATRSLKIGSPHSSLIFPRAMSSS